MPRFKFLKLFVQLQNDGDALQHVCLCMYVNVMSRFFMLLAQRTGVRVQKDGNAF